MRLCEFLISSAAELSVDIPPCAAEKMLIYLKALRSWNRTINLTAITEEREIIIKHFVDSLAPLRWLKIQPGVALIDIGSGAGFPGLPLKIMREDVSLDLLEPVKKRASFLRYMVGILKLKNVKVWPVDIESFSMDEVREKAFDLALMRAIRATSCLPYLLMLLRARGKAILYRTTRLEVANLPAGLSIEDEHSYKLPHGYGARIVTILTSTA